MTNANPTFVLGNAKRNGRGIGNCAVLSVTAATGLDYDTVERAMVSVGMYRQGRGTHMSIDNMDRLAKKLGFTYESYITNDFADSPYHKNFDHLSDLRTFNQYIKANRTGNHVLTNMGHAVAVCEGKLIDNGWLIDAGDKRNFRGRRAFLKAFRITMNAETPEPISHNISTSNPGTQLSIF